jgi:hypothetical protein
VRVWRAPLVDVGVGGCETVQCDRMFTGHARTVTHVLLCAAHAHVMVSRDAFDTVRVWDIRTGALLYAPIELRKRK